MLFQDESLKDRFSSLKAMVQKMLDERNDPSIEQMWRPSAIWLDANKYLNFIMDCNWENLLNIRIHTGFITGIPCLTHAHQPYRFYESDNEKEMVPLINKYKYLTGDIPDRFWTDEPITTRLIDSVGVRYKGRLISDDLVRYQVAVTNLYNMGVFSRLDESNSHAIILEIGGGYGGLAHQLGRVMSSPHTYLIVDLPEMLFWSGTYLIANNPTKKVYVYDADTFTDGFLTDHVYNYDFVLIPNFKLPELYKIHEINLMINTLSFQEMTEPQIRGYAQLGYEKLNGFIYSDNFRRHWLNKELKKNVSDILRDYFILYPEEEIYQRKDFMDSIWFLYVHFGTSRNKPCNFKPINNNLISYSTFSSIGIGRKGNRAVDDQPYIRALRDYLNVVNEEGYKILIYGARGVMAENVFSLLSGYPEIPIQGIVDRGLCDIAINGFRLYRFEDIPSLNPDTIIITAETSGPKIYDTLKYLKPYLKPDIKILPLYDLDDSAWKTLTA